jgi:hypothetical protein
MRVLADGGLLIQPADNTGNIDGAVRADRARRMLDGYMSALRDAGFKIARPEAGNLIVLPQPQNMGIGRRTVPGGFDQRNRMQANRAAVAANEAYRAGDFDRARQHTSEAAALDPSRAALWQQHRSQIDARELFLQVWVAHAEGDQDRAQKLMDEARQLDPRMQGLWDRNLPRAQGGQRRHTARTDALPGNDRDPRHVTQEAHRRRTVASVDGPQWPGRPALHHGPGIDSQPGRHASGARRTSAVEGTGEPSAEGSETAEPGQAGGAPTERWHPGPAGGSQTASPMGARGPASPPRREIETQDVRAEAGRQAAMPLAQGAHSHSQLRRPQEADPAGQRRWPGESARQGDTTDWRDAMIEKERQEWQPKIAQPGSPAPPAAHVDVDGPEPRA